MKKFFALLLAFLCAFSCFPQWSFGMSAANTEMKEYQFRMEISFEKNMIFSTYDIILYLDNKQITQLPHGKDYIGMFPILPGVHFLTFISAKDSSVDETLPITVNGDTDLSCSIQVNSNQIKILDLSVMSFGETPVGDPSKGAPHVTEERMTKVDGNIELSLLVKFQRNLFRSKYNVNVYCDDTLITTLVNGQDYNAVLGLSEGAHILRFQSEENPAVNGVCQFYVAANMFFSCDLASMSNNVSVTNEMIGTTSSNAASMTRDDQLAASKILNYEEASRFPDKYSGIWVQVSGKVVQSQETGDHHGYLIVQDSGWDLWYISYYRIEGEERFLEGDRITVFGKSAGVEMYSQDGMSSTVPEIFGLYIFSNQ